MYTLIVTNAGPDAASAATITDTLPVGVMYVSDDGEGAYNPTSGVWTVGNVPVGDSNVLNITATVD